MTIHRRASRLHVPRQRFTRDYRDALPPQGRLCAGEIGSAELYGDAFSLRSDPVPVMLSEPSSPFRRYSFRCDGVPHSTAFYHTPGLTPEAQTPHLEMQFNVWLELTYPGCRAAGRISHIAFTDEEHLCGEPPPDTPGLWVGQ